MKVEHYYKPDSKTLREEPQVLTRWQDPIIEQLQQENKHLNLQLDQALKDYEELLIKIDKAIEYIKEIVQEDEKRIERKHTIEELKEVNKLLEILGEKENVKN